MTVGESKVLKFFRKLRRHGLDYGKRKIYILYDLGPVPIRTASLIKVIGFASRPTAIILDDMHAAEYGLYVKKTFKERGLPCLSVRRYTNDRFGRYAHLALT